MREDYEKEIKEAIHVVIRGTSFDAKRTVRVDKAGLKKSIKALPVKDISGTVWVSAEYAAFVEFGTGSGVQIPAGYEEDAAPFKGAGIRDVHNYARPYLIPAFEKHSALFIKDMDKRIDKIGNKNWR